MARFKSLLGIALFLVTQSCDSIKNSEIIRKDLLNEIEVFIAHNEESISDFKNNKTDTDIYWVEFFEKNDRDVVVIMQQPYYHSRNNDGFIDAFGDGENISMNNGNSNNWVTINTVGTTSNINGIGARIEIVTPSGTQIRDVRSGEGFEYMSSLNVHFGLGTDTAINNLVIYWPSGTVDNVPNLDINTLHTIIEGQTLSVQDETLSDLLMYPNPTENVLNFSSSADISNKVATVFDVNGKKIFSSKLNHSSLDVSKLQSGFYIIRLEEKGKTINRKFIKK